MIFKIPLYFEVTGGINPQNSKEVIEYLSTVFEDAVADMLKGQATKDPLNPKIILKKEIELTKDIRKGFESFVGKGGNVLFLRRDEARKHLINQVK